MPPTTQELKAKATALFASGDYLEASKVFSEALKTPTGKKSGVLYSNRAACYHALGRYEEGLMDSKKAVSLEPTNAKAWYRRGACEDGLEYYNESSESYQRAMSSTSIPSLSSKCQIAFKSANRKLKNSEHIPLNMMKALARAHDISLPVSSNHDEIYRALSSHPLFGTEPKLRLLLIPESQTEPLIQHELTTGPNISTQIGALLGCRFTDSVVLHSEDQIAIAQGNSAGVGIGRLHTSYEAWMDDNAVAGRPLNKRASRLLHRPKTYGPILVQKTTFVKSDASNVGKPEDIVCFERVDEAELLSDHFKDLRAEWVQVKGTGDAPMVIQVGAGGDPVVFHLG
ncbi:hypothetical protein FB451DRAFT_1359876 [Mycena latifolia]|nr:hypothetical protein FB451DRAFT_1359876 [Mycena latifolia]